MRRTRALFRRLAGMFAGPRDEDELRAELETHLEMETAENVRRGMSPKEARRQALLASGGVTRAAERVREQRGLPWLERVLRDHDQVPELAQVMGPWWHTCVRWPVGLRRVGEWAGTANASCALRSVMLLIFLTWRSLSAHGLSDAEAVDLMVRLITGATRD